ncbi:MAG: histone H1 [Gemmatimonadetes bacterium]|nr:histone H1 [Gemmatimonadota bacterium]
MVKNPKVPDRPRDLSQLAKHIVDISTGEESDEPVEPTPEQDRAAKGGDARAAKLTPEERSAIARKAAQARWNKPHG